MVSTKARLGTPAAALALAGSAIAVTLGAPAALAIHPGVVVYGEAVRYVGVAKSKQWVQGTPVPQEGIATLVKVTNNTSNPIVVRKDDFWVYYECLRYRQLVFCNRPQYATEAIDVGVVNSYPYENAALVPAHATRDVRVYMPLVAGEYWNAIRLWYDINDQMRNYMPSVTMGQQP